ncbi:MAG: aminopeptidase [Candidatus Bathyarchaeota archaeon]|nr:aminopeptidase [Candidatus Bathyarchaeota archaeon]
MNETAVKHAGNALKEVMDAYPGEKLLVVSDDVKRKIGEPFALAGLELGLYTRIVTLETEPSVFRENIPKFLTEIIVNSKPDLVVNCLRDNVEETPFRIKLIHLETRNKDRRLGHGPGITLDMLTEGALALSTQEYREIKLLANRIIASTEGAEKILMTASGGTNVEMSISERSFFTDMEITNQKWGNLPTGEVTVGPIENSLKGKLVCDVAIGGIGPIEEPITIDCKNGKATNIRGENRQFLDQVEKTLNTDAMASIVGEMAIGINRKARIVKYFLETEKVFGTAHIAFGRNTDFPTGGRNNSSNHMDFLVNKPTIKVLFPDGRSQEIVVNGEITM